VPLSKGSIEGDVLRCGHHGLRYDPDGRCTDVPGQDRIPAAGRVQSYPTFERWGLVWIWMGDPSRVDEALIPDHSFVRSPGWTTPSGTLHVRRRAQLINENPLDLPRVPLLHAGSIGSAASAGAAVSDLEFDERWVQVMRRMSDIECAAFLVETMGINFRIDRLLIGQFFGPGFRVTHTVVIPRDGTPPCTNLTAHCITPESRSSTDYVWVVARDYGLDDEARTDRISNGIAGVLAQDVEATEAIEGAIANYGPEHPVEVNLPIVGGPLRSRRIIEAMVAAESAQVRPSTDWLASSGLRIVDGVVCDQYCATAPDVYVASDVAPLVQRVARTAPASGTLDEHGRAGGGGSGQALAGAAGQQVAYDPVPDFWPNQFGTRIQSIGHRGEDDETASAADGAVMLHGQHGRLVRRNWAERREADARIPPAVVAGGLLLVRGHRRRRICMNHTQRTTSLLRTGAAQPEEPPHD
jgi:vanillate O-demethylase monooxygenase subunit